MSVRTHRTVDAVVVRRGRALDSAERVGPQPCAEYNVVDSGGEWFGTAVNTSVGVFFVLPPEMNGVRVMPPFHVQSQPSSARLASSLGATLSLALLSTG